MMTAAVASGSAPLSTEVGGSPSLSIGTALVAPTLGAGEFLLLCFPGVSEVAERVVTVPLGISMFATGLASFSFSVSLTPFVSDSVSAARFVPSAGDFVTVSLTGDETSGEDAAASSAGINSESTFGETTIGCEDNAFPEKFAALDGDAGSSSDKGTLASIRSVAFLRFRSRRNCQNGSTRRLASFVVSSKRLTLAFSSAVKCLPTPRNRRRVPNVSPLCNATPK